MIFIFPTIFILLLTIADYKKGFKLFLLYQMIWYPETQLISIGDKWINLNFFCSSCLVALYFIKIKKIAKESDKYPFSKPMVLIAVSLLLTCFTSYSGFFSEFIKAISLIVMDLLIVYIMWKTLNKKDDFIFLFKGITLIIFIACIYVFFEKFTQLNPILDYKITCTANGIPTYSLEIDARGYRCYSIFEHSICACMVFALYAVLAINIFVKYKKYPFKKLSIITAGLCIPAMFFTQQRAGMLVFLIGILSIINFKSKRFWKTVLLCFVAALIIWPFISDNVALLLSIFNSKYEGTVSGSSISMRFEQLNAVFKIMQEAPFTGLGEYVDKLYRGIYASKARGYESLWFEQMAKHGIIGVFAYIVMIYYSIYKIPKKYHSKELFFISLSYWMTYTLTSTPYFRIYFLYGIIFYYIKSSEQFHGIASVSESNIENLIRG